MERGVTAMDRHSGIYFAWLTVWREYRARSTATAVAVLTFVPGVISLYLGEGASKAFDNIGGALFPHLLGALMVLGSALAVAGILKLGTLVQLIGLVFIAAGTFIYGFGVILGLGWQGSIAGSLSLIICIGALGRVAILASDADKLERSGG